jgi:hypothetical protein
MKFRVEEVVQAPRDAVWAGFADFAAIEAEARARGATLTRIGGWDAPRPGAMWRGSVAIRGKPRDIEAQIVRFEPAETFTVETRIGGMDATYTLALVPLDAMATKAEAVLELRASTLSARLILQSAKIARRRVLDRIEAALARQARGIERDRDRGA